MKNSVIEARASNFADKASHTCIVISFVIMMLIAQTAPSTAASTNTSDDLTLKQGIAAFDCAALAAITDDPLHPSDNPDVDRLFRYGVERLRASLPDKAAVARAVGDLGPWHEATNMNVDFWIGVFWSTANGDMSDLIYGDPVHKRQLPAGAGLNAVSKAAALHAENEFTRRNCDIVGK